jgi:hypothetical protein
MKNYYYRFNKDVNDSLWIAAHDIYSLQISSKNDNDLDMEILDQAIFNLQRAKEEATLVGERFDKPAVRS